MKKSFVFIISLIIIIQLTGVIVVQAAEVKSKPIKVITLNEENAVKNEKTLTGSTGETEKVKAEGNTEELKNENGKESEGNEMEEEPAWKIAGWKIIFSFISILFFAGVVTLLPKILTDKSAGGTH
jgi:hypothetical protein